MNTQSKVTAALQSMADELGYDLLQDGEYANTGTFRFQRPTTCHDTLTIRYDFQSGYVSFESVQLENPERVATRGVTTQLRPDDFVDRGFNNPRTELSYQHESWYRGWYLQAGTRSLDAFLKAVSDYLTQHLRD